MIKEHDYLFKLVIVGNQGVGKSALFMRFCDNSFVENYLATIGVDFRFKMLKVEADMCKLQIWDTAGQERFRTITSAYYRSSQVVLIVYDVTDPSSFHEIEEYWLQEAKNNTDSNTLIYIVGNKADKTIEVQDAEIQGIVDSVGVGSYFVSAKSGDGVEKMFMDICQELITREKLKPKDKSQKHKKKEAERMKFQIELEQRKDEQSEKRKLCCKN